jgi:hypothetical protein
VRLTVRASAHAAVDPVTAVVDNPVVHGIVGIHLPVEEVAVELLELLRVLSDDLEVDDRLPHFPLLLTRSWWLLPAGNRTRVLADGHGRETTQEEIPSLSMDLARFCR